MKKIDHCYDSHVHWRATGDFAERLSLSDLKVPQDILKKEIPSTGQWILGYGWHFSKEETLQCTRLLLDQWCKDVPVALSMSDGHSLWVNTKALEEAGLLETHSSGLLREGDRDRVLKIIPKPSMAVMIRQLLKAQKIFHDQGITHIRDVHMTELQWAAATHLEEAGLLKLAVEVFVFDEALSIPERIRLALNFQEHSSRLLRVKGVKVFLDGSLGSDTAAVSAWPAPEKQLRYSPKELEEIIHQVWSNGLEIAIHCIGDVASDTAVQAALDVQKRGSQGKIHFEHVQILQEETILKMKELNGVCHLQPAHWLDDKKWLEGKIGAELMKKAFPWRRLQESAIPFFFGSDSPLSLPGVSRIQQAVEDASQSGHIPRLLGEVFTYISHPDLSWPSNTFTEIEDGRIVSITFEGEGL